MLLYLLLFIPLLLVGCHRKTEEEDYLSPSQTNAIKGFFALLFFFCHIRECVEISSGFLDQSFTWFLNSAGQIFVTPFFFYSGYGIMESVKKKNGYVKTFFKNRIVKTFVHFEITVVLYIILGLLIGKRYEFSRYLWALTGFRAIGNTHWFVFDIIYLYCSTYIALRLAGDNKLKTANYVLLATIVFFLVFYIGKRDGSSCWYDTIFCFPFGMYFSLYRHKIHIKGWKRKCAALICLIAVLAGFYALAKKVNYGIFFNLASIAYVLIWCLITSVVVFDNRLLQFLGHYAFPIILLHRLPIHILTYYGLNQYRTFFILACLSLTISFSIVFEYFVGKLDRRLFHKN